MRSLVLALLLVVGCGSKKPNPGPGPGPGSGPEPGSGSAPAEAACPPPKPSTEMCAAVMTYAKTAEGKCCEYGSPCTVAVEGQQYSDAACTTPMGPAKP